MTTTVRERPIIFSGVMVRALLDGRKSQTRRVIKPRPNETFAEMSATTDFGWQTVGHSWRWTEDSDPGGRVWTCPHGVPGDRLWVRETIRVSFRPEGYGVEYRADGTFRSFSDPLGGGLSFESGTPVAWIQDRWDNFSGSCPSIHMPRWASRITLEVTSVRVGRVQDISEADAKAEGLAEITKDDGRTWKFGIPDLDGLPGGCDVGWPWPDWDVDPRKAYARLWDRINGKRPGCAWADNPFVWAIEFRRIPRARGEGG